MKNEESKISEYKFVEEISMPDKMILLPGHLKEDFGEDFLEEYLSIVKEDYGNVEVLKKAFYRTETNPEIVRGANPYAIVLVNQILKPFGLRTVSYEDVINNDWRGYADKRQELGLVLKSEDGPNEYLAKDVARQLRSLGRKEIFPTLIRSHDLTLRLDEKAPHKLAFDINKKARFPDERKRIYRLERGLSERSGLIRFHSYQVYLSGETKFDGSGEPMIIVKDKKYPKNNNLKI